MTKMKKSVYHAQAWLGTYTVQTAWNATLRHEYESKFCPRGYMFCTRRYDASPFIRSVLASDNIPTREKVICGLVYSYIHTREHMNAQTREYDFYGEIICLATPRVYFPGVLACIGYRMCLIPCMYKEIHRGFQWPQARFRWELVTVWVVLRLSM